MTIITGWRAIAQTFGVTQSVARSWREQGAPILLLPGGKKETVPAANVSELWAWLSGRYGPAASSHAVSCNPACQYRSRVPGILPEKTIFTRRHLDAVLHAS